MSKSSGAKEDSKIKVTKNGPYLVLGGIPLRVATIECDTHGTPAKWVIGEKLTTPENYALCRCGESKNKPFCDGTHVKGKF